MIETNYVRQDKTINHVYITVMKLLHSKAAYVLRNTMGLDHSKNLDRRDSTSHQTWQTELSTPAPAQTFSSHHGDVEPGGV